MWNSDTLQRIDVADDLKIAPYRPDGVHTGTPTWIWAVVVDGRLFVRAYHGKRSRWHQAAQAQGSGNIHAIGQVFAVRFAAVTDAALQTRIDAAYRAKYGQSQYLAHMIAAGSRAATMEITPCS